MELDELSKGGRGREVERGIFRFSFLAMPLAYHRARPTSYDRRNSIDLKQNTVELSYNDECQVLA